MKNTDYFDVLDIPDNRESVDMIQTLMGNKCLGTFFQNGSAKLYFNSGLRRKKNGTVFGVLQFCRRGALFKNPHISKKMCKKRVINFN